MTITFAALCAADEATFTDVLGAVFEHSPWVARGAWASRPFASVDALHGAMVRVMQSAPHDQQLALICAHPQLAGKPALLGQLSTSSNREQVGARLTSCTTGELAQIQRLNANYLAKHNFPFVMAVKHRNKAEILERFAARIERSTGDEFTTALDEIGKIARFRLDELMLT